MPTYEYKCTNCSYTFEYFQPMTAEPLKECPECKGILRRIIGTGAGPIFKGSGFYQTDYKSNSSQNKNSSKPSSSPAAGEKKSETKSKE